MAHIYCNLSGIHLNTHIRILCRHTLNKDKKANKSVMDYHFIFDEDRSNL